MHETNTGTIDGFVNEHYFMSNFYRSSLWIDEKKYPSAEHAYHAHKTLDPAVSETISHAKTAWEAKRLGRCVQLRPDWDDVKVDIMTKILRAKFENPLIRTLLIATSPKKLINRNSWNDKFWGVCRGEGLNTLGVLLENLRDEFVAAETIWQDVV